MMAAHFTTVDEHYRRCHYNDATIDQQSSLLSVFWHCAKSGKTQEQLEQLKQGMGNGRLEMK